MAPEAKPDRGPVDPQVGLASRRAAAALLHAVLEQKQVLDQILGRSLATGRMVDLSPRDRALARAIIAASLRHKGQIDALLSRFLERGLPPKSGYLYVILLSATAQLLFLQTPAHAAIDLAVTLTRYDPKARRFDKLANAVLRRIDREGPALVAEMDAPRLNTPEWLWKRWVSTYGEDQARAIGEIHMQEPPLDLTVKADPTGWAERLGGRPLLGDTVRLQPKGRIEHMDGFAEGSWWVQDVAATLPVRLFGECSSKRILDFCAAPGGKTAQLLLAGASVCAVDISEPRLKLLQNNLTRLGLAADVAAGDAASWTTDERFDGILLDAPCSATGTIRRHPDIPYLKSDADIANLAALQSRLIDNALTLLKPGGTLVYATCSLEPEEGEAQIAACLARHDGLRLIPVDADEIFGRADWLNAGGAVRTLPCGLQMDSPEWSGMDGFFAARLTTAN